MDAYILDAVRTPRGKGTKNGALKDVRPIELSSRLLCALCERNRLDRGAAIEDVILGCVTAIGDQGANIAKTAALYAGLDDRVSGLTINRFCASGLTAVGIAALMAERRSGQLFVAGGVESMSRVPLFSDRGAWFADPDVAKRTRFVHMGVSADLLATQEGFGRKQLDEYALESHRRATVARDEGRFASLLPVRDEDGAVLLDHDETIRDHLDEQRLGSLVPAFAEVGLDVADAVALRQNADLTRVEHVHTVATSPALADAAALLLVGSAAAAQAHGLVPRARIVSHVTASVEPVVMLTGNVVGTEKALADAKMTRTDIDLFEVNESFAAVPLHYGHHVGVGPDRLNVNGGAIAMGHPLGATGAILVGTLLDELERRDASVGLASVCGGGGVAATVILERC